MTLDDILKGINPISVTVAGVPVKCVDVAQLAKLCGRKASSIRWLEREGKFPAAPFRLPGKTTSTGVSLSKRIYPLPIAVKIAAYFREHISQGREITADQTAEFYRIFKETPYAG